MFRSKPKSSKVPDVTVRRRPNDFGPTGPVLMQTGTCACCCCCCLHWIGAGIGGPAAIIVACRAERKKDPPIHPTAKKYVLSATGLGVLGTAVFCTAVGIWGETVAPHGVLQEAIEAMLMTLAFVPSLAFLPVGAAAMLGGAMARRAGKRMEDPEQRQSMSAGLRLGWRIAWMSFLISTFLSGIGYLIMMFISILY